MCSKLSHAAAASLAALVMNQPISASASRADGHDGAPGFLLVVVPRALSEATRPYVQARSADLPARMEILEDILADSPGVDDPEKLKRHLFDVWGTQTPGAGRLRYVLLVGDADVLPVRYMCLDRATDAAFNYAFYPSDLYYADLAGEQGKFDDWNASKDGFHAGYFGEVRGEFNKSDPINYDHVDYRPELCVGRWPVSTPEQCAAVVSKSLAYARGVLDGSRPGPARAGVVAVGGWIENRPMMDAMAESISSRWNDVEKRYWRDGAAPPPASPAGADAAATPAPGPDEGSIITLLNQGASLVLHSGHGSDDSWDQSIHCGSIARLTNADRLPIVMSAGCSTARFATLPPYEPYVDVDGREHVGTDRGEKFTQPPPAPACYQRGAYNPTGLGERLLRDGPGGAVAYIGCNTGSQPCGMTLMAALADRIRAGTQAASADSSAKPPRVRLGDCWAGAQADYYDREHLAQLVPTADWYPASIFFQGMKFMLYGDPSLPLVEADTPSAPTR